MQIEILMLIIFSVLFVMCVLLYKYGDKIPLKKKSKSEPPKKKKVKKPVVAKPEKPEQQEEKEEKTTRPVLLSPAPMRQVKQEPKQEPPARPRTIDEIEINEIKKFIESKPSQQSSRQGLSDYNKIETFGDVIDLDDDISAPKVDFDPYVNRPPHSGESEFLKNRGEDKSLYEELKNMSPEIKKIIMADILKKKH